VAGEEQQRGDADELGIGELIAVFAHQHAEHVVAGRAAGAGHQRAHVLTALPHQLQPFRDREGQVELPSAAALEVVAAVVGHAEQLADDQRGDRQCELRHQIGWRTGLFERFQAGLDDLDDARFQRLHPAHGEFAGQHPPQPGVLRRVEAQQVACPGAGLFLLGQLRGAGHHEARRPAVGEVLVIGEHGLDVVVAGDQVHLKAEGVDGADHSTAVADVA
jgi:hypothetical protein